MPQNIRVLQCVNCKIFQADIVKKSKKWKCRVCEEQQTVRKEVFRGLGTECRTKVQELNMQKAHQQNNDLNYLLTNLNNGEGNNEKGSCSKSESNLHDVGEVESTCNTINKAQDNDSTMEDNLIDLNVTTENTNMFNFTNTQKWSKDKSVKLLTVEHNDCSTKKKSKWDSYV